MTTSSKADILVKVDGLCASVGTRDVLHGVSFEIPRGGALALVGESGSGKTVTSRVLTGILDRIGGRVTAGKAYFDGVDLCAADSAVWRRLHGKHIALVPQASLSSLNPLLRVGHHIEEAIRFLDPETDRKVRALELLDQVQLANPEAVLRAYPHMLSGGMRQRIMIALALAGRPELIIADEPTTALDVTVQKEILTLLSRLRKDAGLTLLMVAHDLAVVNLIADTVAVMQSGRIVEVGQARKVLTAPRHAYTRDLLSARVENGTPGELLGAPSDHITAKHIPQSIRDNIARPIVEATGVGMSYPGRETYALKPVSLTIEDGATIGIIGESGSGKSTLGKILVGALQPVCGSVHVAGIPWSAVKRSDTHRRDVQMIFQDPYAALPPWRTSREIVADVVERWNETTRMGALKEAGRLLDEVGLVAHAIDRRPAGLSGGQCQRVGIARALACKPRLIIGDEPTASLDASGQAQILDLLTTLRKQRQLALVIISHDLAVIRHLTNFALVLKGGELVESGPPEILFNSPQHPYTRALIAATPSLDQVSIKEAIS
jgi:peptide/nickel transport system ATP-binding protein